MNLAFFASSTLPSPADEDAIGRFLIGKQGKLVQLLIVLNSFLFHCFLTDQPCFPSLEVLRNYLDLQEEESSVDQRNFLLLCRATDTCNPLEAG